PRSNTGGGRPSGCSSGPRRVGFRLRSWIARRRASASRSHAGCADRSRLCSTISSAPSAWPDKGSSAPPGAPAASAGTAPGGRGGGEGSSQAAVDAPDVPVVVFQLARRVAGRERPTEGSEEEEAARSIVRSSLPAACRLLLAVK